MSVRPRIIEFLREAHSAAADHAIVAALPRVAPELQVELLDILLARGGDDGLAELPSLFDQLIAPAQTRIIASASRLFTPLRSAIRSSRVQTRTNRAYTVHDVHLIFLTVDPKWDPYRSDPRFTALLERCGFART